MDDTTLVRKLKNGEEDAFDSLYEQYHLPLYRTARLMTGSVQDAEDILQETFLTVYQKISQLKDPTKLTPWIWQILGRTALKVMQKREREMPDEYAADLADSRAAGQSSVPDAYELAEARSLIAERLRRLTPEMRQVIVFYYYQEMTTKEIAGILGISEGTVKSRLHYARRKLQDPKQTEGTRCEQPNKNHVFSGGPTPDDADSGKGKLRYV